MQKRGWYQREPVAAPHDRRYGDPQVSAEDPTSYIRFVKDFAALLGRSPDTASFEDVRRFQLHLAATGAHVPMLHHAVAALRFFFKVTFRSSDIIEHTTFIHEPRKLPVVLSRKEVAIRLTRSSSPRRRARC